MLVKFSNHIPHLVVGTLLLPDRESAKIHSNQANPIIRGPNQSLTSPTGMHNSLPLLNPNYSIGNVHPFQHAEERWVQPRTQFWPRRQTPLDCLRQPHDAGLPCRPGREQRCCGLFRKAREKAGRPLYFWEKLRSLVLDFEILDWEILYRAIAFGRKATQIELIDTS